MSKGFINIWKQAQGFGKVSYPFRVFSYISGAGLILAHHYENQLALSYADYFVIAIVLLLPHLYFIQYVRSGNNMRIAIRHMTSEFLLLGLGLGALNLSVLPCFIFTLAITLNYISVTGYSKLYGLLLVPIGFMISFSLDGFNWYFGYGNLVTILSLTYGTIHFLILAFVSFNYANRYHKGQKTLIKQNKEIELKKKEILLQAQKLTALNESLQSLNNTLEEEVRSRTRELHEKNKKLTEYAFINAHKLRAPVASILGLVQFFDYNELSVEEEKEIKYTLRHTVSELDKTIADIRKKLEHEGLAQPAIDNDQITPLSKVLTK